jgi:hypothetical protein
MKSRIVIRDIIKTDLAVSSDKAVYIAKLLREKIENQEAIVLDFSNIKSLTTAFLNVAVGELYATVSTDIFNKYIFVDKTSLSSFQYKKYQLVLENSGTKRDYEFIDEKNQVLLNGYIG